MSFEKICNEEYDKWTCMFLGVQAEFSAILLDLTMVIGVAHALNLLLGVNLSTGVFLAAMDAFFFPVFASFLENGVANTVSICSAGLVLLLYVSGVLMSQSEIPFSMNGVLTRLNGESAFALMGLLGASIVPHKFYIHSYFTGERTSESDVDKSSLCQEEDKETAHTVTWSGHMCGHTCWRCDETRCFWWTEQASNNRTGYSIFLG